MKLSKSQQFFIEVGRIEGKIIGYLNEMVGHEVDGYEMKGSELEKWYNEKISEQKKKRRYLLRKAKAAYNKEMNKHETK